MTHTDRISWRFTLLSAGLSALIGLGSTSLACAQADTAPAATSAPAEDPAADTYTRAEIEPLVAPYALYPDELLAQVLPSTAYPIELVQLSRWLAKNKGAAAKADFAGVDSQSWDPSVKSLARFPTVVDRLNIDLDATTDLGDAFVNQPDDVAAVIQELRRQAQKAGSLKTSPQQRVTTRSENDTSYVVIEPAEPGYLYVPTYDPVTVYDTGASVATGLIGFGLGIAVGIGIDNSWDWGRGWVYPPRWPGYPGYRPGYGGNNNINIGNDINIGNGNTRPWRPDGDRYRPGQGSKPGIGNRPGAGNNRPGPGDRPGLGNNRPGPGDRPGVGNNRPGPGDRPGIGNNRPGPGDRPGVGNNRPAKAKPAPGASRPNVARPAPSRPSRDTAFSDARFGGASRGMADRGAASRQSMGRPGGGRPSFQGGGRGGGGAMRGGGGRGGGGGGGGRMRGRH